MTNNKSTYQAQENLLLLGKCPTWYDYADKVYDAMAEEDRIYDLRTKAGWELDEGGWWAPCPDTNKLITELDWLEHGLPSPEDL